MNNNDVVGDALASLRQLEPTMEARMKFRQGIAGELARIEQCRISASRPWWRRSFSVPVPVAMGACLLLLVFLFTTWSMFGETPDLTAVDSSETNEAAVVNPANTPAEKYAFDRQPQTTYSASETYLCGVGRIQYESVYQVREN